MNDQQRREALHQLADEAYALGWNRGDRDSLNQDIEGLLALLAPEPDASNAEIEHARNMVNSHAWTLVDALRSRANEQDKRLFDALHEALTEQGRLEVAAARAARQTGGES